MIFKSKYTNLPTHFAKAVFDRSGNKLTLFRPWIRDFRDPPLTPYLLSIIYKLFMLFHNLSSN